MEVPFTSPVSTLQINYAGEYIIYTFEYKGFMFVCSWSSSVFVMWYILE